MYPAFGHHDAGVGDDEEEESRQVMLCGAEVNALDVNGCSPIFYSVALGYAGATRYIIPPGSRHELCVTALIINVKCEISLGKH